MYKTNENGHSTPYDFSIFLSMQMVGVYVTDCQLDQTNILAKK